MSEITYTLPASVVSVIEQTGSPSAGLRKLEQMRGLIPVARLYDVTMGGVRKRERLGQFCSSFAPQIDAAKQEFAASQAPAPTTRKPKAPRKSAEVVTIAASELRSLEQRLEALEAMIVASEPKAAPSKGKLQVAVEKVAKARKAEPADAKLNTFGPKVVAKFNLPTKSGKAFVWPSTGTTFVVVAKHKDGGIEARKAA